MKIAKLIAGIQELGSVYIFIIHMHGRRAVPSPFRFALCPAWNFITELYLDADGWSKHSGLCASDGV